ncbi:eukaryotic translation initiation factor 2D isoform X1 [Corythoichthys intestinalis]|uniref:eukaryotic translation initiation factor 2D isoform X1 n=1 Tax=Corythoichthys intestinalis TaxID=161448 RepID=UPI0025A523F9|nr:eukaryotic translation initiation factor 2D isoform X1 [Corythoichthys intestinalis]
MFAKQFRVKSNTVMKGSDRRKLKADISAAFPSLSSDELTELVPNKEELNVVKIYTHKGDGVTIYVGHKNPLFFEIEKQLYPTVYTLWRYPAALPTFRTWPLVLNKLIGGADLMLPGVVVPFNGLPNVKKGDRCAVTLVNNRAPVAVGTAVVSSAEMVDLGMKGRGVYVLHTYMDHLWSFGEKSCPPPLPDEEGEALLVNREECVADEPEEGAEEEVTEKESGKSALQEQQAREPAKYQACPGAVDKEEEEVKKGNEEGEEDPDDQKSPQEVMDALLWQCFLLALKSKVKKSELPLLTSTFLRNHMFSCCPSGKLLDIKKSSYKKLSKFLQVMQEEHSIVQVKELTKGVESIVEVDWKSPELRFSVPEEADVEAVPLGETLYHPPEITTLYSVSVRLQPLFEDANKRKGVALQPAEVRSIVTEYVKNNDLVDEKNKNYVRINPILCDCLLEKSEHQDVDTLKWDELFSRTLGRMQLCHQIVFPGQPPVLKKGHIEPIDVSVASRGSNKKVTIIKNLEMYALDPSAVATALQHRVQASSVLQPLPGAKDKVLVQIQGNQIQQVGSLLLDHYRIPRKYIQGLDKAPKGGKK